MLRMVLRLPSCAAALPKGGVPLANLVLATRFQDVDPSEILCKQPLQNKDVELLLTFDDKDRLAWSVVGYISYEVDACTVELGLLGDGGDLVGVWLPACDSHVEQLHVGVVECRTQEYVRVGDQPYLVVQGAPDVLLVEGWQPLHHARVQV